MSDTEMVINLDTKLNLYNQFMKGGVGAEIGVCRGANAACLLLATRPKKLHLVDTWVNDPLTEIHHPRDLHYNDWEPDVRSLFSNEIDNGTVVIHKTTGVEFLNSIEDSTLDWVYLDGDHSYDNLSAELTLSALKVRAGGIIAGHDFLVLDGAWGSGVVRAVIDEIQKGKIQMKFITDEKFPSYLCTVNRL